MANQPTARPWFRLSSLARPPPPPPTAPTPTPEIQPPTQQRPALVRSAFTTSFRAPTPPPQEPAPAAPQAPPPRSPPPQPQEPAPASPQARQPPPPPPPPPAAAIEPSSLPTLPPPAVAQPPPRPAITTSVPSSPIRRSNAPSSSLPSSPVPKGPPISTSVPVTTSSSSMPPSPKPKNASVTASSVPNSPDPKISSSDSTLPRSFIRAEPDYQGPKFRVATSTLDSSPKYSAPAPSMLSNSPAPKFSSPTSSLQPKSPPPKPVQNSSPTPKTAISSYTNRLPTPPPPSSPPKFTKPLFVAQQTPPQSPKIKSTAPPPSPLVLPPSMLKPQQGEEIEAEQKTVLVQETTKEDLKNATKNSWHNNDSKNNDARKPSIFHRIETKNGSPTTHSHKKYSASEEVSNSMRVITLAGENKGAVMELTHSPKNQPHHGHFEGIGKSLLLKKNGNGNDSSTSSDEGKSKMKDKSGKKMDMVSPSPTPLMNAYMNSNVQGINNSVVYNCSYTHHDPGVHLTLSKKPNAGGGASGGGGGHKMFHLKDNSNGHHS